MLNRATFVVLPYRKESYEFRISRAAIEAGILGKPLIYSQSTWTEAVVEYTDAGVAIEGSSVDQLCRAMLSAVEQTQTLTEKAVLNREVVAEVFSAENFCRSVLKLGEDS